MQKAFPVYLRRLIYLFFILFFVISAPLLVLYTAGFRYNLQKNKMEQVGVLLLDVEPKNANFFINGEEQSSDRPLRLTQLKPNFYQVRAERKNYYPWQKNLEIKNRASTLACDIVLFKYPAPVLMTERPADDFSLSPDGEKLAILSEGGLWIKKIKNETESLWKSDRQFTAPLEFFWSKNGSTLLLKKDKNFWIVNPEDNQKLISLNQLTKKNFDKIRWAAEPERLFGQNGSLLLEIDLAEPSVKKIADKVEDFEIFDGALFIIKQEGEFSSVYKYSPLNIFHNFSLIRQLTGGEYKLGEFHDNFLVLKRKNNEIYLLDATNPKQPLFIVPGWNARWGMGPKNNFLYYYDGAELWIFDPKTKKSSMLERFENNLKKAEPLPDIPYYLLQVNQKISVSELDDRDRRQTQTLFEGRNIQNFTLDNQGKNIYFLEKMREGNKLLKLEIR
ncbi:MAG: hypothetical protein HY982_00070 [Candidatus Magasanikbacteria bacterium]|nr:hypothetical protein [Candidatus Magasanikbacteria bacterium]